MVGRTGVGKSTLLGAINGLVPHFTGGTLAGRVTVDGRDTRTHKPRELADVVGVVGQDPLAGFVTDTVEEELAYGMEQLAVPPDVMRKRVEETLDLLGIAELRDRAFYELSGGQQQRVAIGSVLTAHPRVLVLDEPTSALDPTAAEEVLAAVTRLVHDLGVTVVLAEHRLERVVQYADRVVEVGPTARSAMGSRGDARDHRGGPAGRRARPAGRWAPLPLSVRDARRRAGPLRARSAGTPAPSPRPSALRDRSTRRLLSARNVVVRYGAVVAVRGVDLDLMAGEVTALMGRNGSGKSSLLWALQGSGPARPASSRWPAPIPKSLSPEQGPAPGRPRAADPGRPALPRHGRPGARPGRPGVGRRLGATPGAARPAGPGHRRRHAPPRPLRGPAARPRARRPARAAPRVVLLDEPTRGLDYPAKRSLIGIVDQLAAEGRSVVVATHDVEFVAAAADRVVVMAAGDVVADGPTADVVWSPRRPSPPRWPRSSPRSHTSPSTRCGEVLAVVG